MLATPRRDGGASDDCDVGVGPEVGDRDEADVGATLDTRALLRRVDFWLLFWVLFVFYLYRLGVNTHLVAFLSDRGYSAEGAAGGFSAMLVLGIGGKLLTGTLADRFGVWPIALGNFSLIAIASALLVVPDVPLALPAFLGLHGFATAAEDVVVPLVVGRRFGTTHLASVYGLLLLALVPGGSAGPLLAGWAFDTTGSYAVVFTAFLITNLSAVAALEMVRRRAWVGSPDATIRDYLRLSEHCAPPELAVEEGVLVHFTDASLARSEDRERLVRALTSVRGEALRFLGLTRAPAVFVEHPSRAPRPLTLLGDRFVQRKVCLPADTDSEGLRHVGAGAIALARAGDDHHPDRRVGVRGAERVLDLGPHPPGPGVQLGRSVQGDLGEPFLDAVNDLLVGHETCFSGRGFPSPVHIS